MTATASHDWVDGVAGQRIRRKDELEHWVKDLHVTLNDDRESWLTPEDDLDDVALAPLPVPQPTEDHIGHDGRTTDWSTDPSGNLKDRPSGPYAGRHRAAD
jgi:hypothetical protein